MKKTLLAITLLICGASIASAQYTPNTLWPYLYENFEPGTVYYKENKKSDGVFNVHLLGSVLHYLQDGTIYQATDKDVARVEIGGDTYIYDNGKLMKVIAKKGESSLLKLTVGDFESLLSKSGAYGASSSTHSTKDLSSLEIKGLNNPSHGLMLQEKNDGRIFPLAIKYYILVKGELIPATRKDIEKSLDSTQEADWKKFTKENKIKWKSEEQLAEVLNFFN